MSDRNLDHLHPKVAAAAKAALSDCEAQGMKVLVTCTLRSRAEQTALYAQGRTTEGPIVTHAKAGQSMHQYGCALDLYPNPGGKPDFTGHHPWWPRIAAIFKAHGFKWGAEWQGGAREMAHFEMMGGHPLSYFQQGGTL